MSRGNRNEGNRDTAIAVAGLCKTYRSAAGPVQALRGIDLDVARGEFFGVLGPNGAGKSTTIGILTTLVRPSGGTAVVAGHDVVTAPSEVKARIGIVAQQNNLDAELSVGKNLEFRGRYFGMSAALARRRAAELLDQVELTHKADAMITELSGGQAKRVAIARALVHEPQVLFLDEPTASIDPQTRLKFWQTVQTFQAQGLTVLLTTHYLEEAESLYDRVAIIDHGTVLACDTVPGLTGRYGGDSVITVTYDGPARDVLAPRRASWRATVDGDRIRLRTSNTDGLLGELIGAGERVGRRVLDVSTVKPNLESTFFELTGRDYRG